MFRLKEIVLEPMAWCPLRCRHCSSSSDPDQTAELALDTAYAVVADAASLGAEQLSLGGGEPTSSPLFAGLLEQASSLGMACEVYTSGVSVEDGRLGALPDSVVAAMARSPKLKAIFSVHGPSTPLHDEITQTPGSFDCLRGSLAACLARGIACEMNFVALRPNAASLADIVGLAEEYGLSRISILRSRIKFITSQWRRPVT